MNILAFDTSGNFLSIGLRYGAFFLEKNIAGDFRHSEQLLPEIKNLMAEAEMSFDRLNLIVCSRGPGSFTGLRIGMSTAKGLSAGCGAPVVSVSSLDCLSSGFDFFDGAVVPVVDARKRRYYTAIYRNGKQESDYLDIGSLELLKLADKYSKVLFIGIDVDKLKEEINKTGVLSDKYSFYNVYHGLSGIMTDIGKQLYVDNGPDHEDSGPAYIRKSDAEINTVEKGLNI